MTDTPALTSQTVGEVFEAHGPCALMAKVVELAQKQQRIPVGEWDYRFTSDPRWRLCINGGKDAEWTPPEAPPVKRFEVFMEFNGWPAATFNVVEGCVIGVTEDQILAAFDAELEARIAATRLQQGALPLEIDADDEYINRQGNGDPKR